MHNAPSVSYPVGRSRSGRGGSAVALWLLGVAGHRSVGFAVTGERLAPGFSRYRPGARRLRRRLGCVDHAARNAGVGRAKLDLALCGRGARRRRASVCLDLQQCLLVHLQEPACSDLAVAGTQPLRRALGRSAPCGMFPRQTANAARGRRRGSRPMTRSSPAGSPSASRYRPVMLVERTVAGDQKAFELLVLKYQRRIERLIGRMVRDIDLVEDIAQETFIRAYRALYAVPWRGPVLHLAVPDCRQYRQEGPGRHEARPAVSESALRSSATTTMKLTAVENEPTSAETPETVLAAKEIAAAVDSAMEALARGIAPGGDAARDRRAELRRDCGGDELSDRHGAFADLPGARGYFDQGQAHAGQPVGQALVGTVRCGEVM